jgi:D-alanine-D-alanine ligase
LPTPCSIILKPAWEDASVGIDDGAILRVDNREAVEAAMNSTYREWGETFAEHYIEGREFNLSLLSDGDGVEVLPPAEIEFVDYPAEKPHIVGYKAKWDEASFEYGATPRRFYFATTDKSLLRQLRALAVECWHLFGLRGYARVDFRVDDAGRPWVLEVNVNPCLSADAGFMAAANYHGLTAERVVERIIDASFARIVRKEPVQHA